MAVRLVKAVAYLVAGAVLVWAAGLPAWASYLVGCWCGANAMGYLVSWAMARVQESQEADRIKATVVDFVSRRSYGKTTH